MTANAFRGARYLTRSVAVIVGWKVQRYSNVPFFASLYRHDAPGAMVPESKPPGFDVTVWGRDPC